MKKLIQAFKAFFMILFQSKADGAETSFAGLIADAFDNRDRVYSLGDGSTLPTTIDLTPLFGPVESQGSLNTCVGHCTTAAFEVVTKTSDRSRLFVYYNARAFEGRTGSDAGCQLRNGVKAIATYGVSEESLWPYSSSLVLTKPSSGAYADGVPAKALVAGYARVLDLPSLKKALSEFKPVVFGFSVPKTFLDTKTTGYLPYPVTGTTFIGSHAVVAVGYDDAKGTVLCRNSFGSGWGKAGYFEMPYQWFANMSSLVSDAWVIIPKV